MTQDDGRCPSGRSAALQAEPLSGVSGLRPAAANARIADILDKAADLITPEGAWTREWFRVPRAEGGYAYCALGAIEEVGDGREGAKPAADFLRDLLGEKFISAWNDRRSKPQVVSTLREAAAKAREQGL